MNAGALSSAFEGIADVFASALIKASGRIPSDDKEVNQAALGGTAFAAVREQAKTVLTDPYAWNQNNEQFNQRPSQMGWNTLRRMASTPMITAIHQVRCHQISEFCRPQENPYLPGYRVRLRNVKKHPTRNELKMMADLERWVLQCGTVQDQRQLLIRHDLSTFAKAVVRDSLTFDQGCAEMIPSNITRLRDGAPVPGRMQFVDASTIRIANTALEGYGLSETDYDATRFVQVIDDTTVTEYDVSRMMFGVRNPSTNIYSHGYGTSELEMMVRVLTAWLNAFDRNFRYFTQGFNARGLLNLKRDKSGAKIPDPQLAGFRRQLQMLATGVQGAHRIPVTNSEGIEWINLGNEAQDMQWSEFSDLNIKLGCAVHNMDPSEINFVFGNTGQSSAMSGANAAEKIEASRSRGLIPLTRSFFDWINKWVIWQIDPDFELVPTGVQARDEKSELELAKMRVESTHKLNEVRASLDLPPLPGKQGEIIFNANFLQGLAMNQEEDEAEPPAEEMDVGGLFGDPDSQATGDAGVDAGQDSPDVIPTEQPLAASKRRIGWRTTTIEL